MDTSLILLIKQHIDLFLILFGLLSSGIYYGHNVLYKITDLFKLVLSVRDEMQEIKKEIKEIRNFNNKINERVVRLETSTEILMAK